MKFSEIKNELVPFRDLIESIPKGETQGIKVAHIFLVKLEEVYHELAYAEEQLQDLKQKVYGGKGKELEPETPVSPEEKKKRKESLKSAKKKLQKVRLKNDIPAHSEPEHEVIMQKVPDKVCDCCQSKVLDQGFSQSAYELDYIPAKIVKREFRLHSGTCACGEIQFVMPRPKRILENRTYTADLLAKLIVDKFRYHLPIYRQTKQLADLGLQISRSVLNDAVLSSWQELEPIWKLMWEVNRRQSYRHLDETPVCRIVDKKVSKKYYLWGMYTELAITFKLTVTRNTVLAKRIAGPDGTVITDGLRIYNERSITGTHVNCLANVVQRLLKAISSFPEKAEKMLSYLIGVYEVDCEAFKEKLTDEQRKALRQEKSKPLMEELLAYLEEIEVPPRSSMGIAVNYIGERWEGLTAFLQDGAIPLDNNPIEALFKDIKLGMKNMLFVQSELGGDALAGFYSLIATCELHGINPNTYIADVLEKIAGGHPAKELEGLLAWNCKSSREEGEQQNIRSKIVRTTEKPDALETVRRLGIEEKVTIPVKPSSIPPPGQKKTTNN